MKPKDSRFFQYSLILIVLMKIDSTPKDDSINQVYPEISQDLISLSLLQD